MNIYFKSASIKSLNFIFLVILSLLGVIFFISKLIITSPELVIAVIFFTISAVLFIKKPAWVLAILITLGISICGAVPLSSIPSIQMPIVGTQIDSQFLLLLICIMILKFLALKWKTIQSSISYPIAALLILTASQGIRSFLAGNYPHFILDQVKPILFYMSYFLVLSSFRHEKELYFFLKLIIPIGIISAGVTYFQIITGTQLSSKIKLTEYNIYKPVPLSLFAMTAIFLSLFSIIIRAKKGAKFIISYIIILIFIGGVLILLHIRNIWVSTLLCIAIIIILNSARINKSLFFLFIILIIFLTGTFLIKNFTEVNLLSMISEETFSIYHDVKNVTSTFRLRTESLKFRWEYMIRTNPLFGQGYKATIFDWKFQPSYVWDPSWAEGDNFLAFLATRYGLSGFFIFAWLLFSVFSKAIYLFKILPISLQRTLVCGILAFNIQMVIVSYFSSVYVHTWAIIILAPSWAVLTLIERFYNQRQKLDVIYKKAIDYGE